MCINTLNNIVLSTMLILINQMFWFPLLTENSLVPFFDRSWCKKIDPRKISMRHLRLCVYSIFEFESVVLRRD